MAVSSSARDVAPAARRRTVAEIDAVLTRLGPYLTDPAAGPIRRRAVTRAIDELLDERSECLFQNGGGSMAAVADGT